jgi:hypothetical protein
MVQVQKNGWKRQPSHQRQKFHQREEAIKYNACKGCLNNGEHRLIPVMAMMIHSAIWNGKRFVLKDGRLLHMVKLVGAVRIFGVNVKHVQIDLEDGTGLVQVILW